MPWQTVANWTAGIATQIASAILAVYVIILCKYSTALEMPWQCKKSVSARHTHHVAPPVLGTVIPLDVCVGVPVIQVSVPIGTVPSPFYGT